MTTYNKVIINGVTKIDLSSDTVTAADMLSGITAHDKNGDAITGSIQYVYSWYKLASLPQGATSLDTIDRGYYLQLGPGYIPSAYYFQAQPNSGTVTISSSGTTSVDGYVSASVAAATFTNNTTLPSGATRTGTISRGKYLKISAGYNDTDKYYLAQADAHSAYTPSSTYFQTSTTGAVSAAKINKNNYATSDYYVKAGSASGPSSISESGATVSTGTNTLTLTKSSVDTSPTVSSGWVDSGTGSATVALTASIATKAATTYNTSASNQTIASGTYLTGAQTIRGVTTTNLTADNIKKDVVVEVGDAGDSDRILSVTGTFEGAATCTTRNGGATWAQAVAGSGATVGWREEKYSDGRLIRFAWDFWNASAGDGAKTVAMTVTASDGSGPTAFVGTPEVYFFQRSTGSTAVSAAISLQSWSNTTHTYYMFFSNNGSNRRIAVSTRMEGYWQ